MRYDYLFSKKRRSQGEGGRRPPAAPTDLREKYDPELVMMYILCCNLLFEQAFAAETGIE